AELHVDVAGAARHPRRLDGRLRSRERVRRGAGDEERRRAGVRIRRQGERTPALGRRAQILAHLPSGRVDRRSVERVLQLVDRRSNRGECEQEGKERQLHRGVSSKSMVEGNASSAPSWPRGGRVNVEKSSRGKQVIQSFLAL